VKTPCDFTKLAGSQNSSGRLTVILWETHSGAEVRSVRSPLNVPTARHNKALNCSTRVHRSIGSPAAHRSPLDGHPSSSHREL